MPDRFQLLLEAMLADDRATTRERIRQDAALAHAPVQLLLEAGADAAQRNKRGSTAFHLNVQNTGGSGSGSRLDKTAQRDILAAFFKHDVRPTIEDANGKTVLTWPRGDGIRQMLEDSNH